nr:psbP domain-containing protein 3, chloroplastic isoform X3 [Ipomoea batatas]
MGRDSGLLEDAELSVGVAGAPHQLLLQAGIVAFSLSAFPSVAFADNGIVTDCIAIFLKRKLYYIILVTTYYEWLSINRGAHTYRGMLSYSLQAVSLFKFHVRNYLTSNNIF